MRTSLDMASPKLEELSPSERSRAARELERSPRPAPGFIPYAIAGYNPLWKPRELFVPLNAKGSAAVTEERLREVLEEAPRRRGRPRRTDRVEPVVGDFERVHAGQKYGPWTTLFYDNGQGCWRCRHDSGSEGWYKARELHAFAVHAGHQKER